MTTFQDPPPQSRRAVRQSERAEHPDDAQAYSFDPTSPEAAAEAAAEAARAEASRAESPARGGHRADPAAHAAAASNADPVEAEPLEYMTQARVHQEPLTSPQSAPPSPIEQSTFRVRDYSPEGRRAALGREQFTGVTSTPAAPPAARPLAPEQPVPPSQIDLDYFTQGAPAAVTPPASPPAVAPSPAPVTSEPSLETGQFDHTVTRRELRELRAAQQRRAEAKDRPESIENILNSGPIAIPMLSVLPGQSKALADAMAEFDLLARNRKDLELPTATAAEPVTPAAPAEPAGPAAAAEPVTPAEPVTRAEPATPAEPVTRAEPVEAPPAPPASAAQPFPFRLTAPSATEPPAAAAFVPPPLVEPLPLSNGPLEQALMEPQLVSLADIAPSLATPADGDESSRPFVAAPSPAPEPRASLAPVAELQQVPAPPVSEDAPAHAPESTQSPAAVLHHDVPIGSADPVFIEPDRTASRPVGHWSVQAEMDDDDLGLENTISRTVGAGTAAITTSALVLPSVPEMGDLLHPFTSTGEILVTGTIDLPRSLGSTGAHPHRVDNSDFEDDPLDSQVVSTDSAPVRAIRAISTHTSTRGVIEQKRRQTSRMPAVMIVVASVLALGVVSLLVVAFATGLFR